MDRDAPDVWCRLLGSWSFVMQHAEVSDAVTGHQHYEPVLEGAFVLQRWSYDHRGFPDAMALLTADRCHYFDVRGITRLFSVEGSDDGWTMRHIAAELSQRFTARFLSDDVIETTGEASRDEGASWRHDFVMTSIRVAAGPDPR